MAHIHIYDPASTPLGGSDMELIRLAQTGNRGAFGELWRRHHRGIVRAAYAINARHDPEDLAQEAFTRVLQAIQRNSGPKQAFRAYLHTSVRSISINWDRNEHYVFSLEQLSPSEEPRYSFEDRLIEETIMSRAFATLKREWREVLWFIEVEGLKPREVAPLLGISANATSALAYRAREALRLAWHHAHLNNESVNDANQSIAQVRVHNRKDGSSLTSALPGL
ncbi:hypothetical protein MB46_19475 (plasmid) [Arthrobacter alpinus]|nr:hypothetical protein MB46_19475 [Arthrobacter alpinus]